MHLVLYLYLFIKKQNQNSFNSNSELYNYLRELSLQFQSLGAKRIKDRGGRRGQASWEPRKMPLNKVTDGLLSWIHVMIRSPHNRNSSLLALKSQNHWFWWPCTQSVGLWHLSRGLCIQWAAVLGAHRTRGCSPLKTAWITLLELLDPTMPETHCTPRLFSYRSQ